MSDMKYLDFDVAIEPTEIGYATRVFNSPVGQATATFGAPFSDLEIENFLLRVGRSRHTVRRIESPEMASAKAFGGRLFDQVFTGEVRGCLRSSIDEASRQGTGLRVRLHLTKVPALADLPWEFLYNANMNRFLSLSVETPLVRYLELPERIRPLIVHPPLHVLMMISSPSDYPQLDVNREATKMTEAFSDLEKRGLVTVERLEDATLSELQRRLRNGEYHIFHFVGHGGFDGQAEDGILIMEDQENRGRRVSAQFLGTLLHDHRPLRLAVLNACEGGRASRGDPFAGTAQSLVQQGIPAVIAMQFEVTDEAAICFTREFYSAIAGGYPVDAALAEARKAIFAEVSEIEWGTPVLYMRSPDGRVFEIEQVSEATRKQLQISSLLSAARTAAASNDQPTAIDKLKQVLALEPAHAEASTLLREIAREKELEALYASARASCDAGRWRAALDGLRGVQAIDRTYRDVQTLIAHAEQQLARAHEEELRKRPASEPQQQRPKEVVPTSAATAPPRQVGWVFMGAFGAVAALATLMAAGIGLIVILKDGSPMVGPPDGPNPQRVQTIDNKVPPTLPADPPPAVRANRPAPAPPAPRREDPPQSVRHTSLDDKSSKRTEPAPTPVRDYSTEKGQAPAPAAVEQRPVPPVVDEPPIVTPLLRDTLEAVIRRADDAEIQAFSTLNPSVLARSYTGKLLEKQIEDLRTYANNQIYMVNRLHNQQFESFTLSPDGRRAQVRLTEVWSTNFQSTVTGQCVSHFHEHAVPQTLSLQLTNQGWMIYDAQHHAAAPQMTACH